MSLIDLILKVKESISQIFLASKSHVDIDKDPILSAFPDAIKEFFHIFEKDYNKEQLYAMMGLALTKQVYLSKASLPSSYFNLNEESAKEVF